MFISVIPLAISGDFNIVFRWTRRDAIERQMYTQSVSKTQNDGKHFSLDKSVKRLVCRNRIRWRDVLPFNDNDKDTFGESARAAVISVRHFQPL